MPTVIEHPQVEPIIRLKAVKGTWKGDTAPGEIASGRMTLIGGDADVFTKQGRSTRVTLNANNIRLSSDGKAFLVDVYYDVYERHSNNTWLKWQGTCRCDIPLDSQKGSAYVANVREYERTWDVYGEEHDRLPVPLTEGTCITNGSWYRIDGKGEDWTNAAIDLVLGVGFYYFDRKP